MNLSRSALFDMKTRVCLKYFMNGCSIQYISANTVFFHKSFSWDFRLPLALDD